MLSRPSLAERAQQRKQSGQLSSQVVAPRTLERYKKYCVWFFLLLKPWGKTIPSSPYDFDELVAWSIDVAWSEGEGRNLVGDLLSGLSHLVPALRSQLPAAWRLWRAWGRLELLARAWPLGSTQVTAMAAIAWQWNFCDVAVLLLLGFHGFLRAAEIFSLRANQISFATDGNRAFVALPHTRTQARKGAPESFTVENRALAQLLYLFCQPLLPGDLILQRSPSQFRELSLALVNEQQLTGDFKPYSLRRGGATEHFRQTNNMDLTCDRGRWNSVRTCRIYVNTAFSDVVNHQQDERTLRRVEKLAKHLLAAVELTLFASGGLRGESKLT